MVDLSVNVGGLAMRTPVATASGTFGYGTEYAAATDYSKLGAVTVKGVRMEEWPGNPMPRHCEVFGGLVNAIGLQGPGAAAFAQYHVPHYADAVANPPPLIVNVWGGSIDEYAETAAVLSTPGAGSDKSVHPLVAAIEMNVSCPNVKAGGHTFGQDPKILFEVVKAVRAATKLPLFVKLAPNVPDLRPYVAACEEAGADALSLINTIPAMVIDVDTRKPVLGNATGGLSGRCVHPVAVKCVYDAHRFSKLPILAMGGVYDANDAIELMLAGASAVAVGTATFTDPNAAASVCDGIAAYCERNGFASVRELTGALAQ
ncbi:MAG: dihydroorotate dehydrogenase [Kiritimatiellae bacterium]|nr:dihydroorotate dehydrogenase [Kiritimatiellia bacterium]